ncbi:lysine-specific histone demethylase 2-like [Rhopilema esculentum]|uniref:lysine-specific histone demethylase 2-like n=1 Tax=Rhopilema esculentum TaxID=499914 RepID=UPI0031D11E7B
MASESAAQCRRSGRTPKRKQSSKTEDSPRKRTYRKCEKTGCPREQPACFAKLTSGCARDGYTSRWYHLSNGEHFCNECFDYTYRSHKEGNKRFTDWKLEAAANCQKELSLKLFFAEEVLNYWVLCHKCKKWRSVSDTVVQNGVLKSKWHCSKASGWICMEEEAQEAQEAKSIDWLNTLTYLPLLKYSSPFSVLKEYFPDGIGFSALSMSSEKQNGNDTESERDKDFIQPFHAPDDTEKAGCYSPDIMLPEEKDAFPYLLKYSSIYLGLRNLALSIWNSNVKAFLSLESCLPFVVIRGLTRITMCEILKDVLDFLTISGRINFGVMSDIPRDGILNKEYFMGSVIVIGAGFAGLSAAVQLTRAGCKVKVLEARDSVGGRVQDDTSLGACVSKGPQIITGCINNPMYIMNRQLSKPLRFLGSKCNLIDENGEVAGEEMDQKVEFYFNLMLEPDEDQRNDENQGIQQISLKNHLDARKLDLEAQIYRKLTKEEEGLLQFHLANLEYAFGAPIENVSALNWNQNESMLQFAGDHAWVEKGFGSVTEALSKDLDINLSCEVVAVNYAESQVQVTARSGETFSADKVVVAVPLSVLKKGSMEFLPSFPEPKKESISKIGAGVIEKVVMQFKKKFWSDQIETADYFGHIPDSCEDRGFGCLFYDVSGKDSPVLMALLAGDAALKAQKLSDENIVDRCLQTLAKMFPKQTVDKPSKYFVTRWGSEEHIEMTYSYIGVNASGEDYDVLAETIDEKIYFAGEATNRQFPQTVTGAFISGLREARKILKCVQ